MPVTFDFRCNECNEQFESLLKSWRSENPNCPKCGKGLERLLPSPACVWAKPYGDYGDPTKEYYRPGQGVVAYRTKTTRHIDGTPEKVVLNSMRDVITYCHDEGLTNPADLNPHSEISKDGRKVTAEKGRWI